MSTKRRNLIHSIANWPSKIGPSSVINGIKLSDEPDSSKVVTVQANDAITQEAIELSFTNYKVIGNGSFGVVFQAKLIETDEFVAIKKVLQDKRFKNRELQIMRLTSHPNVIALKAFFYSNGQRKDEVFLNLVLEYIPETLYKISRSYNHPVNPMPIIFIKLYMYQLLRSLAHIHSLGICHRDIKPQNLLLDANTGVLKLIDFGSSKLLVDGEPNVSYICSRYYRAPELIFGSTKYDSSIDIWSAGCVLAEMLLGVPLFAGLTTVDQMVQIIKVLGTPTREQIISMNPDYTSYEFPKINSCPWTKIVGARSTNLECESLISELVNYIPAKRVSAIEALCFSFFEELRRPDTKLPNGNDLPPLFNFTQKELDMEPQCNELLVPSHARESLRKQGIDVKFLPCRVVDVFLP